MKVKKSKIYLKNKLFYVGGNLPLFIPYAVHNFAEQIIARVDKREPEIDFIYHGIHVVIFVNKEFGVL